VQYARSNFFAGEDFRDITDCRERAVVWCAKVAGTRVHGTTQLRPAEVFAAEEQPLLLPVPETGFVVPSYTHPKVAPDRHVEVAKAISYEAISCEADCDRPLWSIFENVLDLFASLLKISLGLVGLSFGLKAFVVCGFADSFLGPALQLFSFIVDFVASAHQFQTLPVGNLLATTYPRLGWIKHSPSSVRGQCRPIGTRPLPAGIARSAVLTEIFLMRSFIGSAEQLSFSLFLVKPFLPERARHSLMVKNLPIQ
jgi:hypothetical protein